MKTDTRDIRHIRSRRWCGGTSVDCRSIGQYSMTLRCAQDTTNGPANGAHCPYNTLDNNTI